LAGIAAGAVILKGKTRHFYTQTAQFRRSWVSLRIFGVNIKTVHKTMVVFSKCSNQAV